MPTTPLFTDTDLANVARAIASGELEVKFADRTVQYRSIDDLIKAKNLIENYLAEQSGTVKIRQIRIYTDNGF